MSNSRKEKVDLQLENGTCDAIYRHLQLVCEWPEYLRGGNNVPSDGRDLPKRNAVPSDIDPRAVLETWKRVRPLIEDFKQKSKALEAITDKSERKSLLEIISLFPRITQHLSQDAVEIESDASDVTTDDDSSTVASPLGPFHHPAIRTNPLKTLTDLENHLEIVKQVENVFHKEKGVAAANPEVNRRNMRIWKYLKMILKYLNAQKDGSFSSYSLEKQQKIQFNANKSLDRINNYALSSKVSLTKRDHLSQITDRRIDIDHTQLTSEELSSYQQIMKLTTRLLSKVLDKVDGVKKNPYLGESFQQCCENIADNLRLIKGWPEFIHGGDDVVLEGVHPASKSNAVPDADLGTALQAWKTARPLVEYLITELKEGRATVMKYVQPCLEELIKTADRV